MRRVAFGFALIVGLGFAFTTSAQVFPNLGGQRVGISGLVFLKNDLSPRSSALGGANGTLSGDGYSVFTNPAALAEVKAKQFTVSGLRYGAGFMHSALAVNLPIGEGQTLCLNANNLNSGAMEVRTEFQPNGTGEYFYANNMALGLGYGKALSKMFSFGANLKYITEALASYTAHSLAVDLGFLYQTDYKNLRFSATLQHFGTDYSLSGTEKPVVFTRSGPINLDNYQAPTLFKMAISMDLYNEGFHKVMGIAQLNHPNDNAENLRFGAEYSFRDRLYGRLGYKLNVKGEPLPTFGLGAKSFVGTHLLDANYSFVPTDNLGVYHTFGVCFSIGSMEREEPKGLETENPAEK